MPKYRLVFPHGKSTTAPVEFVAPDARQALIIAQRHEGPAELWCEDEHICTLDTVSEECAMWFITQGGGYQHAPA